jgi:putative two-component system response regulator
LAQPASVNASVIQEVTQQAIAAGATDCFVAPLNLELVLTRCETYIFCAREVKRHIGQLRLKALNVVMDLVGLRDQNTGEHIRRTRAYVRMLCQELSKIPRYADALTPAAIEWIALAAPLHDIGKLSVSKHLLQKAAALTPTERIIMQTHPLSGMLALEIAELLHTGHVDFFRFAKEIALCHHEKWDGTGYPMGLKGDQIPLSAQLVAVADAYDALCSQRSYKSAQPHAVAVTEITASSGTHFSPVVVEAFLAKAHEFAIRSTPSLLRSTS